MSTILLTTSILLGLGLLFIGLGGIRLWLRCFRLVARLDHLERELRRYDFFAGSLERTCKHQHADVTSRLSLVEDSLRKIGKRLSRIKSSL